MITVACVWVNGHVHYPVEYVKNLRAMVARHLRATHRFVCLTDRPHLVSKGIEAILIDHDLKRFGWWAKIELFNAAHRLEGRVLYLDLDTLVVSSLDPVVSYGAPFALVPAGGAFSPRAYRTVKRFNSSVMVWDAGVNEQLYRTWTPQVARWLHGDQDWIGETMPTAATMPAAWFPRLSELNGKPPAPEAKVLLAKKPKNVEAARRWPWFDAIWRAA